MSQHERPASTADLIATRLAREGYRLTGSRRRLLDAVLAQPAHFTLDDLLRSAPGVSRATVFRTMRLLLAADVVCRVLLDDGSLHYRLGARGHHHHLVCRVCGRVEDFSACGVGQLAGQLAAATDYQIEGHWLELYGRCAACAGAGVPA